MPPRSAAASLARADDVFGELGTGKVATVQGRYFAMDRDKRWSRIEPAYDLITQGITDYVYDSTSDALAAAYERDENDEFVAPSRIGEAVTINDGDSILFMNFRAIVRDNCPGTHEPAFSEFERKHLPKARFVATTEYFEGINAALLSDQTSSRTP